MPSGLISRNAAYVLGPELSWALMFAVTALLVSQNQPPTLEGNQQLEVIGWFVPLVGVSLSFVPLAWAPGNRWWWLLRTVSAGVVGLLVVIEHLCIGIDYQDSRNSGVGAAYMIWVFLGLMALLIGAVIAAFFFLSGWRFLPFLKWGLIVVAGLSALLSAFWGMIFWLASFGEH